MSLFKQYFSCALMLASLFLLSPSGLAQDDDDFIILDDRGLGDDEEPESVKDEGDVSLGGRTAPVERKPTAGGPAQAPAGTPQNGGNSGPPPRRFEPTERVSEDLSVSFPADI